MAKTIACKDLGMACSFMAKGQTEDAVLKKVSGHASKAHPEINLNDAATMAKVRSVIKDAM